ncbi:hypothetical protein GCM10022251_74200 [Phytohabitans flavus]
MEQTGSYIADSDLSRSLPRLKHSMLVAVHDEGTRRPSYAPTPLGEKQAALLTFILDAVEHRTQELSSSQARQSTPE